MFTHPEHIIDIHRRQIIELTREQSHGGSILASTTPDRHPTNGRTLFGRFRAMLGNSTARRFAAPAPTLSAQE